MCKLNNFILNNFNLSETDLAHVPSIVNEIKQEIDDGHYDDNGTGLMSEYTLYDVFDDKLCAKLGIK